MRKKAQLSIEFIMMLVVSFALLFSFAYVIQHISAQKNEQRTFEEVNGLGVALQNEFLLASELENGYTRIVYVPYTINGLDFGITNENTLGSDAYIELTFLERGIGYRIPLVNGTIQKGYNTIQKVDGWLVLN